ncbi:putative bifunctional diguanylate cyclase/phosphodiesterase [Cognatilysobacter bugurensis]|uniref:Bifunctional diguanylate cyclase/phosphodiesterase n=1 Tax=Cognatilysobacter bugurensis TaxID=543356 RepID=A0A918T162_9GAMM|nr:EAL domain-containing protein [Lysobacter bugurensis]GHA84419.1 bifunctional diguanylate cyclase/phosphodiesterase [Lysobacter bugurensis]
MPLQLTLPTAASDLAESFTTPDPAALLDAVRGDGFGDVVAMAMQVLDAPVAALIAHEGESLLVLAERGLGSMPVSSSQPLFIGLDSTHPERLVCDAAADPHCAPDPLVRAAPALRFAYALSIAGAEGRPAGVLLVGDPRPRPGGVRAPAQALMQRLARICAGLLERRRLERTTRIAEQIAHADFSGVIVVDGCGAVTFANPAADVIFGHPLCAGTRVAELFPDELQAHPENAGQWLRDGSPGLALPQTSHDLRIRTRHGDLRTLEAVRCAWVTGGEPGMALILRDVTERRLLRHRLNVSPNDELTGLPRRGSLLAVLDTFLRDRVRPLGVALLGLDHFRTVNDTLGHTIGDAVLQLVACRLQFSLPPSARLARFGGDEFALVYPGTEQDAIQRHLRAVLADLARPCEVDHNLVHIEASIGVAMCDEPNMESGELVARADLAMQHAKRSGGRRLSRFEPDMRVEAHDRRRLDLELRRACDEEEFELHYQPQIDLFSGRPTGAEALLRWRHPERGLLSPDKFIDALANSSVNATVGRWILERACRDAMTWPVIDGRKLAVGINLFPVQLDDERLLGEVDYALASTGLPPARLELELTETIALRDDGIAASALASLRARGIRVAYDDFGTGYASLSMLQRLPVDRVKIDRSFVRDVLANRGDAAIVRSILLIARNFNLRVIAEGVETAAQAEMLRELGCDEAQGFLYSRALPLADFNAWVEMYRGNHND